MDKKIITALVLLGLFATMSVGVLVNDIFEEEGSYEYKKMTQENYRAMVLSKIVPIGQGVPRQNDIDTKINLQGESGETFRLYESRNFPTEGRLFVARVA